MRRLPWKPLALTGPALLVYAVVLVGPVFLMLLLSLQGGKGQDGFTLAHYAEILVDGYFWEIYARTFVMALGVTLICLLIGVPEAYVLYRMRAPWRGYFLLAVLAPLLVAVVVRTLGWALVLGPTGPLSTTLMALGIVQQPVSLLQTMSGVVIALVHVLVPFLVIAVWSSLQRFDPDTLRAAASLGGSDLSIFRRVVIPQVIPGALAGAVVVFSLSATAFATPAIVGGRRLKVVATSTYEEFLGNMNWQLGSALAVLLLVVNMLVVIGASRLVEKKFAHVFE